MSELSKQQLSIENSNSFPNNNAGLITPALLRGFNNDMIDSTVNQTAFNGYTGSNDQRVSSLETNSGSVNTSITNLNQATASFATTGNNTFTGIQNFTADISSSANVLINGDLTINPTTSTKLNGNTDISAFLFVNGGLTLNTPAEIVWIGASGSIGSGFSASVDARILAITGSSINTGSFATTGSNAFVGNQTITGSVTISGSASPDVDVIGTVRLRGPGAVLQVSASNGISQISSNTIQIFPASLGSPLMTNQFGGNVAVIRPNNLEIGFVGDATTGSIGGWNQGPAFYVNNDPGDNYKGVFGFQNKATFTDGRVAVLTPLSASAGFTASLQSGHVWAGNSLGQNAQVATSSFGGSTDTGSLMVTGSVAGNVLTFTKGDASTFDLTVDTGSFATTGSNTFVGNQRIVGDLIVTSSNEIVFFRPGTFFDASLIIGTGGGPDITMDANDVEVFLNGGGAGFKVFTDISNAGGGFSVEGPDPSIGLRDTTAPNNPLISLTNRNQRLEIGDSNGTIATMNTASFNIPSASFTASLAQGFTYVGDSNGRTVLVATSSFGGGGGQTFAFPSVESISGSFLLSRNGVTSGSAGISHITGSTADLVNIVINSNFQLASTVVSGSGNIFTNLPSITGTRGAHMTSANLALHSGITSLTASAASVSGNRPTVNGNILTHPNFFNIPLTINQSVNPGVHTYSANILNGGNGFVINALGNTGNITMNSNVGVLSGTINSPSRSIAQVNAGETGSQTLNINNNLGLGGFITYNGTVGTAIHQFVGNSIAGTLNLNVQSQSRQLQASQNNINGLIQINDNTVFAPTLGSSNAVNGNIVNGQFIYNNRASSSYNIFSNNINGWIASNDLDTSAVTTPNQRSFAMAGNALFGTGQNNILISGSSSADARPAFASNLMVGNQISASIGGGEQSLLATSVLGQGLHVFGTSIRNASNFLLGGQGVGSTFVGRFNDNTLPKAGTAETIFAVGTGVSGSAGIVRKTGFLIDSGSNTFVEGTLNVSGSTAITGAVSITETLQLSALDPLPAGADGQLAVSASNLYFFSGSNWNQIAFV